jgi:hypothetical protein
VDALHAELLRAGEDVARIREVLAGQALEETVLLALLRRALPVRFLEHVATTRPWSDKASVLGRLVLNPRTPRALSLRLIPSLFWSDLAEVAASPSTAGAVRVRAEGRLGEMLPEMRLGDRVALGKVATPPILRLLLEDDEPKVSEACLINPRLREEDLLLALRAEAVPAGLIQAVAASTRWAEKYGVRLALALQPRSPLPLALLQISSLVRRDLLRLARTAGLRPLIRAAAMRVLEEEEERRSGGRTLRGSAT